MTTNVRPEELNYNNYESWVYDRDIELVIPGHREAHNIIENWAAKNLSRNQIKVLELGVGTGLTAEKILKNVPQATYLGIDFSKNFLSTAMKRLSKYDTNFICKDFSKIKFSDEYDIIVSVIGIHHQYNQGKKRLFKKIFNSLKPHGIFILGDLVTYRDPLKAAINDARHYHHLVGNVKNEESLKQWAHHHKFLNILAPLEDQIEWLKESGFKKVDVLYRKFNTVLLVARKS